jgi:DNA-binding beta-propeller fold protein YncE
MRTSPVVLPLLFSLLIPASLAQGPSVTMTGNATVDSASVARAAIARANAAMRAGELPRARAEVARAAAAWPTQPAYVWAGVVVGLRMRDTAVVLDALTRYADLGLGRNLTADTALAKLVALPAFQAVAARHAAQLAPIVRGRPVAVLPDSTFYPEGMDVDPRTGFMYVASVRHRTIAELTHRGDYIRELLPRGGVGLGALLAVRVDPQRGVLWATTSGIPQTAGFQPADSNVHKLLRIRLPDGEIDGRWDIPVAAVGNTLGDVAIGPLGDVFVSDSRDPILYRLPADGGGLQPIRHPLFRSLQGVVPAPGARVAFVADYSHGLLKVDLMTGDVIRLGDAPGSTSLGCDGISWHDGAIIAVQNGVVPPRVMRFELDSAWTRIVRADVLDRNLPVADEPTIGAVVGDEFVYVANSQWEKYSEAGELLRGAVLRRPVLISVPVKR